MHQRGEDLICLQRIESLAKEAVACASDEDWLSYRDEPETASSLHKALNELARTQRYVSQADSASSILVTRSTQSPSSGG
jgi:hypothetical protein